MTASCLLPSAPPNGCNLAACRRPRSPGVRCLALRTRLKVQPMTSQPLSHHPWLPFLSSGARATAVSGRAWPAAFDSMPIGAAIAI
jgi:hypothetical protein